MKYLLLIILSILPVRCADTLIVYYTFVQFNNNSGQEIDIIDLREDGNVVVIEDLNYVTLPADGGLTISVDGDMLKKYYYVNYMKSGIDISKRFYMPNTYENIVVNLY
jgi:hypothetical protein